LGFALKQHTKMSDQEIRTIATQKLALVGLKDVEDKMPVDLSGGMKKRVAIARALVIEPKVLLFDEPLSNLDAQLRVRVRGEIRSIQRKLGITAIYVTHDQIEAMTMADKIVLLNAGHVEQIASPEELYARPVTLFTAGFIGTPPMNLLSLRDADVSDWFRTQVAGGLRAEIRPSLILGVRPEAMHLADAGVRLR
jgi:ABC-type sugar transport system ATPase subunit